MEVKYGLLLKKSWNDFKKNLVLLLPVLFGFLFSLGFMLVVGLEVLLFIVAGLTPKANLIAFIGAAVIVGLVDLILLLLIGAAVGSMYIGLLNAVTTRKKAFAKDMWDGMRRFTSIYFKVEMIEISIFLVPLIILGLLIGLAFLVNTTFGIILALILGGLYLLYLIAAGFFVGFGFFFLHPIMSIGKSVSALDLIKQSLKYTRENLGHVVITWAIVFGINFAFNALYQLSTFPGRFFPLLYLIFLPFLIIFIVAGVVIGIWLKLFVFNAYFNLGLKKL